ncbi:hypothetical protein EYF80_057537 [Liparis tanakae]|uniref:Uncharacterized protein n=1 Tax=Liparis tanakae TaxID=230148 RepID=A0A4Z2EVP1_9TELE|nr:hypothetical protein EYF80_057537 [Liparis tanakae]
MEGTTSVKLALACVQEPAGCKTRSDVQPWRISEMIPSIPAGRRQQSGFNHREAYREQPVHGDHPAYSDHAAHMLSIVSFLIPTDSIGCKDSKDVSFFKIRLFLARKGSITPDAPLKTRRPQNH